MTDIILEDIQRSNIEEVQRSKISLDRLYKRYRGICWICRKFCPRDKASRDHIVPQSLGGSDEISNLALAHKTCNSKRGNGYQEIHFQHFDDIGKSIVILDQHGVYFQIWEDRKNGGINIIIAKKKEDADKIGRLV